jgi:hypothetical protein
MISIGADADTEGYALMQNAIEYVSAATQAPVRVSADNATGNCRNILIANNTATGAFSAGRWNIAYDDGATPRTNKFILLAGNIGPQLNTKGDVFTADGARVGNWATLYGVGCRGNLFSYIDANSGGIGTSFAQAYPGLGSRIGTSSSAPIDPMYTDYRGTTYNGASYTAGAGGGTYTLQSGSPAKGMVSRASLSHDLAGNARLAAGDSAGAYA